MTNNKPISIGYFSPGWPAEAFCNGIATAIGTLTPSLRAMGHQVTIIAGKVVDGTPDVAVYDLDQACKRLAAAASDSG